MYEIKIWAGANSKADIIRHTDLLIIPLNKNITDGIIERANALKNIVIPTYREQVKFITSALEEKEREEFSRQKIIKATKYKK